MNKRDPFRTSAPDKLTDSQLLSQLLSYCEPDPSLKADALLAQFGNLANLLDSCPEDLLAEPVLTKSGASLVRLVAELHRRYLLIRSRTEMFLRDSESIVNYLWPLFAREKEEVVYLLSLDNVRRVLSCDKLSRGDSDSVCLPLRTLVKEVLVTEAAAVVLAHNHPSGIGLPSEEDIATTEALQAMLEPLGIVLLDHFVFFEDRYISMSQYRRRTPEEP